jgi:3-hydroxymyristoyl/3-hydroxydecanoyl-(acyl carrier protein) dehydratase
MLNPDVRAVTRDGEDRLVISLALDRDDPAFAGHFPGHPILPGVVQIDWALRLAEPLIGTQARAARRFRAKFIRVITPGPGGDGSGLILSLRLDRARSSLLFEYRAGGALASTGQIALDETG